MKICIILLASNQHPHKELFVLNSCSHVHRCTNIDAYGVSDPSPHDEFNSHQCAE